MSEYNYSYVQDNTSGLKAYIARVFTTMAAAVGITAVIATLSYFSLVSGGIVYKILSGVPMIAFVLLIAELGICFALSRGITKYSTNTCRLLMFVYAAITGVTFSVLPMAYGIDGCFTAFVFATVLFVCMAIIGKTTTVDLSKFSGLFMAGLIAMVICGVVSIFIPALFSNILIGYIGLLLFLGLTAFDMQKIKSFYNSTTGDVRENLAVYGAFQLYLDFINIFLYVLRILGNRSRD